MKFLVKADQQHKYYLCENPEEIIIATTSEEVIPAIEKIEKMQLEGYYLAGWISYEASNAFNPRHKVLSNGDFPLLLMMATKSVKQVHLKDLQDYKRSHICHSLEPHINQEEYEESCSKVLDYIYEGDIYQANYSFRCDAKINCHPYEMFQKLENEHPVPYSIYVETDDWQIISQSPELFLEKRHKKLSSIPMKGTVKRELTFAEDEKNRLELSQDRKSQAENVMIVDLMRNDLSRICELETVKVPELFKSTRYHSLHQLTSTVTGELKDDVSLVDILKATFPAGSITGAPKIRSMEIISELEKDGRKLYTGSAGIFLPGGDFILNVCIRTLLCQNEKALLGIGSGIVADSAKTLEWEECLLKSRFLNPKRRHSEAFETMLWNGHIHYFEDHINRLQDTCEYFLIPFNRTEVLGVLNQRMFELKSKEPHRVRLAIKLDGTIDLKVIPLEYAGWDKKSIKIKISDQKTDSTSPYQYHKTDYREQYNSEYKTALEEGYDEVIFFNEKGELSEGAITNIFICKDKQWFTPPIESGILNGTWRKNLIKPLNAKEKDLTIDDLKEADDIIIGNSVKMRGQVTSIESQNKVIWKLND
ncbi:MAG: aminodeoxychorismate synthase component I [Lentisphaeraceae bacterium]|nr:aminodeoxychorismate synthase component I [Lentisphaeraceae bacterium]